MPEIPARPVADEKHAAAEKPDAAVTTERPRPGTIDVFVVEVKSLFAFSPLSSSPEEENVLAVVSDKLHRNLVLLRPPFSLCCFLSAWFLLVI